MKIQQLCKIPACICHKSNLVMILSVTIFGITKSSAINLPNLIIKLLIRKPTIKLSLSYITYYSYISQYKRLLLSFSARCEMIMCRFQAFYNVNIQWAVDVLSKYNPLERKRSRELYLDKTSPAHCILTLQNAWNRHIIISHLAQVMSNSRLYWEV